MEKENLGLYDDDDDDVYLDKLQRGVKISILYM
jgi:hypothetical protein